MELLRVAEHLITEHGAVSEPVARAMAEGALKQAGANIALSVTGIAGPGGGTKDKPVGLVYIARAARSGTVCEQYQFNGERQEIRLQAVEKAVELLSNQFLL